MKFPKIFSFLEILSPHNLALYIVATLFWLQTTSVCFPVLLIVSFILDTQNKLPLPQKGVHPEIHSTAARTIRTSVGGAPINFLDTKSREELLKRRSVGNIITRSRDDVFVLSGRL